MSSDISALVQKCLGAEVSWGRSVSSTHRPPLLCTKRAASYLLTVFTEYKYRIDYEQKIRTENMTFDDSLIFVDYFVIVALWVDVIN